jgi:hypothetical protein
VGAEMLQAERIIDVEELKRLVVRLLGATERCNNVTYRLELMRLADEFVKLIEGPEKSKWGRPISLRQPPRPPH